MRRIRSLVIVVVVSLAILAGGYLLIDFRLAGGTHNPLFKIDTLYVKFVSDELTFDADADCWKTTDATTIHLFPQAARVPHGTMEKKLSVKALHNHNEIAFRLEFVDETEDRGTPVNPDACAIMFVSDTAIAAAQMMGYAARANIWHWLADRNIEKYEKGNEAIKTVRELIATGPGTQTPMRYQHVDGKGVYQNRKWVVVIKRELRSKQDGEFEFKKGNDFKIAFAIWDGSTMESFARKSISILHRLEFEIWTKQQIASKETMP